MILRVAGLLIVPAWTVVLAAACALMRQRSVFRFPLGTP